MDTLLGLLPTLGFGEHWSGVGVSGSLSHRERLSLVPWSLRTFWSSGGTQVVDSLAQIHASPSAHEVGVDWPSRYWICNL